MSVRFRRVVVANLSALVSLALIIAVATGVALYILDNQRLRLPLLDEQAFVLHAEFETAQAVIPGQGQTLNVSGVRIGDVSDVQLKNGRAVVSFEVDESFRGLIREDASLLLRPRTGLKDMFVEATPGKGRPAQPGFTIPVRNTLPDVNTDEFLAALDEDTRDYVELLLNGAGEGLQGRGGQLADVLRRLEPTHRHIKELGAAVRTKQANLRRLTGRLQRISTTLASEDEQVARLVRESAQVFDALASEDEGIRASLRGFPEALRATEDALGRAGRLGQTLEASADRIRPAVRELTAANRVITPAAREVTPLLRDQVRPLVRDLRPLVREVRAPSQKAVAATPQLTRSLEVLNHLFNMIGFNQDGAEGPTDPDRDEGYLFWSSWLAHQGTSVFNSGDANGILRPIAFAATCNTLKSEVEAEPQLEFLQGLTSVLTSPEACGS